MERKNIALLLAIIILVIGAFLRLYNFSDWLHFELDQARDIMFVSEAVQKGPQELPLLGPKAGGTNLRLGPAFYYLEYLSALIFGDTPAGHAAFVAVFSILSIPLLFFLLRRFFSLPISLGLAYLYAISNFFVLHTRFAWNPNVLPFFILGMIFSAMKVLDQEQNRPGRWFLVTIFSATVCTQLHFLAFLAVPLFLAIFLAYFRPRFSWKTWLASALLIVVLYVPVIANEVRFSGENTKAFLSAIGKKDDAKHNFVEKIIQSVAVQAEQYALIFSGDDSIKLPKLKMDGWRPGISCPESCQKTGIHKAILTSLFFAVSILCLIKGAFLDRRQSMLIALWLASVAFVFTLVAYDLAPRFFMLVLPIPYILAGLIIKSLWQKFPRSTPIVFLVIIVSLSFSNLGFLADRFSQMSRAGAEPLKIKSDRILEEPTRVTLAQQQKMAEFLLELHRKTSYPINVVFAESYYRRSIKYLTERLGVPIVPLDKEAVYAEAVPVIILRTSNMGEEIFERYQEKYQITEKKEFGTLSVYVLRPLAEKVTEKTPPKSRLVDSIDAGDILRKTWRSTIP